jgi:dTDP-4-dehydrorhamnose reductase
MADCVIIGANGQLGTDIAALAVRRAMDIRCLTHDDIELDDFSSVCAALDAAGCEVVINTAARHGAADPGTRGQQAYFNTNAIGAWNLARWCRMRGATLVHFSTDYVFGAEATREKPYVESDSPCPVNVYGASKCAGEELIAAYCDQHYIFRVAGMYGLLGCRAKAASHFVRMILSKARRGERLQVVNDQVISPTWTVPVAERTLDLFQAQAPFGLYHLAGSGACTWYELACEVLRLAASAVEIEPVSTPREGPDELALRPRYTALDNARLRAVGFEDLPRWRDSLAEYLPLELAADPVRC